MNKLLGNAPRHPGLWTDIPAANTLGNSQVLTRSTCSMGRDELANLAPELARLSLEGRWIVLISPPNIGLKAMLAQAGVRMDRVLLVHAKDEVETLWTMEKALTNGTSSAVLCWTNTLEARDKRRLELVAKNAVALGVIFENVNTHSHASHISDRGVQTPASRSLSQFH